ncbi:acetolactate synthase 2 catalytic subunit [Ectothiorhodospira lacustris]|uniref:acetolactate synthase 2 catalytic subunit n=1 Tax=Ectothiorhodospira lacustris TaxID=2899127 RepID=UPI001EE822DE|nr:acetolactate synthase 2 catalytic subunit [Ectothiorhodospira lacustris]MCG5511413.1 acetolactate synthase 2 catalytic subunit [Ectothiorhodospira lacustris]MCG5523186.1 acetolactate synthase 2 catalytic subunit [Ectothiorhodospira lacustris]
MPADADTASPHRSPDGRPGNGAWAVLEVLKRHQVETVFGYPGGAIMPLYDAMAQDASPIRHILTRHEQGAAFAANGYARASGRLGVCIATSGPGATNLITAVADAHMDSIPLLVITGQVPTSLLGTDAFQETDVLGLSLPITKHSYLVRHVGELEAVLEEAIHLAQEGRPGPVWVDIPKDVQLASVRLSGFVPGVKAAGEAGTPDEDALERAHELLAAARRPVIYAGGGVALGHAVPAFRDFVARTGAPVVTTLKGIGLLSPDDPRNLGMLGMHGAPCANRAVQAADLLVVVGARFDDRATGRLAAFAPEAQVIHLDVDPAEMAKLRPPEVALVGDLNHLLPRLARPLAIEAWRDQCARSRQTEGFRLPPQRPEGGFPALRFLDALSRRAGDQTYVACDVGQHQMWVAQYYGFSHPRRHLTSGGLGAMGFGLPAAIGAQLAHPDARVVNVSGDGSFMMNVQELATLGRYGLPVKIVLFDNQYLGMVRQQQALFYEGRLSSVDLSDNPDFVQVAQAFGIPARRFEGADAMEAAIRACLETPGPLLLHLPIEREQNVWPIVGPGMSNDQMIQEDVA